MFGYDDILRRLHPFLRAWRVAAAADPGLRPFIIAADVARAFDCIDLKRLAAIVQPLLQQPQYLARCAPAAARPASR